MPPASLVVDPAASPSSATAPPLDEQARSLVTFLAAAGHTLDEREAERLCAALPPDPKAAAKQLKAGLSAHRVDIKHTHALKAVALVRAGTGFLDLSDQTRWQVAAWFDEAPGVSAVLRGHRHLRLAVEDLCERLRVQFEPGEEPLVRLSASPQAVELKVVGEPGDGWAALLVATGPDGSPAAFAAQEQVTLAERLRRQVEGGMGGWLDGLLSADAPSRAGPALRESALLCSLEAAATEEELPQDVPDVLAGQYGLTRPQWDALRKRHAAFVRRHDQSFFDWVEVRTDPATRLRFAPQPFKAGLVETARVRLGLVPSDLARALGLDLHEWLACLEQGVLRVRLFPLLAQALHLASPNELQYEPRRSPMIPLPTADDLGAWLGRLDAVVDAYEGGPAVPQAMSDALSRLCEQPFATRRGWHRRAPAELQALSQSAHDKGLVVCASTTSRFVRDLPLGRWRLGLVAVLSFESEAAVATQAGQLSVPEGDVVPEQDTDDPITAEWLARFNAYQFTADDLMTLSRKADEMRDPAAGPDDRYQDLIYAAVKTFVRQPGKGHAATTRMEALSRLLRTQSLEPWVRRSGDDADASMLSRPVFEAAARCPLVDVAGRAGFDPKTFYRLCVEHARRADETQP